MRNTLENDSKAIIADMLDLMQKDNTTIKKPKESMDVIREKFSKISNVFSLDHDASANDLLKQYFDYKIKQEQNSIFIFLKATELSRNGNKPEAYRIFKFLTHYLSESSNPDGYRRSMAYVKEIDEAREEEKTIQKESILAGSQESCQATENVAEQATGQVLHQFDDLKLHLHTKSLSTPSSEVPIKNDLSFLKARKLDEFKTTDIKMGNTGSKGFKATDSQGEYFIKNGIDDWKDAYAGSIFKFFLGKHSQDVFFVESTKYSGIKLDPTFKDIHRYYFNLDYQRTNKALPPGNGLGLIIAASILLGDYDLKGLAAENSNVGVIRSNGRPTYFKIDHGGAFNYENPLFNLTVLRTKDSIKESKFFQSLQMEKVLEPKELEELVTEVFEAARSIAKMDEDQLKQVLDFCHRHGKEVDSFKGDAKGVISPEEASKGEIDSVSKAVLYRFRQLREIVKE